MEGESLAGTVTPYPDRSPSGPDPSWERVPSLVAGLSIARRRRIHLRVIPTAKGFWLRVWLLLG